MARRKISGRLTGAGAGDAASPSIVEQMMAFFEAAPLGEAILLLVVLGAIVTRRKLNLKVDLLPVGVTGAAGVAGQQRTTTAPLDAPTGGTGGSVPTAAPRRGPGRPPKAPRAPEVNNPPSSPGTAGTAGNAESPRTGTEKPGDAPAGATTGATAGATTGPLAGATAAAPTAVVTPIRRRRPAVVAGAQGAGSSGATNGGNAGQGQVGSSPAGDLPDQTVDEQFAE